MHQRSETVILGYSKNEGKPIIINRENKKGTRLVNVKSLKIKKRKGKRILNFNEDK